MEDVGGKGGKRYGAQSSPFGFEDLEAYQEAVRFRQRIYALIKRLPVEEKYGLAGQMRRAGVSLTNNIAEGHGRYHWQDNIRFCRISRGSLCELVDDLSVCKDQQYFPESEIAEARVHAGLVLRLLNGYLAYLESRK